MNIIDNDLLSVQEARVLAERAKEAQQVLAGYSQEKLNEIVNEIAIAISAHAKELAILEYEETEYGNWQDKLIRNKFICEYLISELKEIKCIGVIGNDREKGIVDIGVPVGVILALCPVTNVVATAIYNTLIGIKSGNAVIFAPHPYGKNTMAKTLDIMISAAEDAGLPHGALSYLSTVSIGGTLELINHSCINLIINTEVPSLLKLAQKTGKPLIYGGMGSGPAFIERTADIPKAVSDIITSKSFDYGTVSSAEQSLVVDKIIEREVRLEMQRQGAYFMNDEESWKLAKELYRSDKSINHLMVGKSPQQLANRSGFQVDKSVKLLVAAQKYVSESNPFAEEKMAPVIAYYIEDDWQNACEKCIELLLSERHGHTMVIHSKDPAVIEQFAIKKPVGRMLVNTPAALGSMGMTTNFFPATTLGCGALGKGITSDNVSPFNLIYIRKVAYGIRSLQDVENKLGIHKENMVYEPATQEEVLDKGVLKKILTQVIEELSK